jgi:DNA polymerase (family 10)
LALIAAIRGDEAEAALFERAAALMRERGIESDADLGPFFSSPPPAGTDLERSVHTRLRYMYDTGAWVLMESAIADLPADLRWLFESGAVTIEQIGALHAALGVSTAADLVDAVERQLIRAVPGLDPLAEYAVADALFDLRAAIPRIPLGRAVAMVEPVLTRLRERPEVEWAAPVGSFRRGQDTVGDIEILAVGKDPQPVLDEMSRLPDVARTLQRTPRRLYLLIDRLQLGIRFPDPQKAGAALLHLTGSYGHLNALREVARRRGGRLTADGYRPPDGGAVVAETEKTIYAALGLDFVPPEIRNGDEEVAAAEAHTLPTLLTRADIRGDLHMHTMWSDGRDSVETMVATCAQLGYQYMAITDHSPNSAASRNLSIDDVTRQADEIAAARERHPEITILQGCEVDILASGKLDLPDRVLEKLDIVLASLHDDAGQRPAQLERRYEMAMRHPLVNLITHPTNRLLPHRRGYDLDYERLFALAVETRTLLEVDGAPAHLDMDGTLARRAIAAGVTLAVSGDCHRASYLERQMGLGVTTARRGWVEARHVVNTRPIADVLAFIAAKRSR